VTASTARCNWVVFSNVPWIKITARRSGPARIGAYAVAANKGPARSGTIMIQGGVGRDRVAGRRPPRLLQPGDGPGDP
jgi:hypothetical protein